MADAHLVQKLRERYSRDITPALLDEAADEIERLRQAVRRIQAWDGVEFRDRLWHCMACGTWANAKTHLHHEADCFWFWLPIAGTGSSPAASGGDE